MNYQVTKKAEGIPGRRHSSSAGLEVWGAGELGAVFSSRGLILGDEGLDSPPLSFLLHFPATHCSVTWVLTISLLGI